MGDINTMRPGDRVFVAWMRAGEPGGWPTEAAAREAKTSIVESLGFVLSAAAGSFTICAHQDPDAGTVSGVVVIPLQAVVDGPFILTHRNDPNEGLH